MLESPSRPLIELPVRLPMELFLGGPPCNSGGTSQASLLYQAASKGFSVEFRGSTMQLGNMGLFEILFTGS
jgi:hypothetical protein